MNARLSRVVEAVRSVYTQHRYREEYDFVFVVFERDWVLYGICKDLGVELAAKGHSFEIAKWPGQIPRGKLYFLSHHALVGDRLLRLIFPKDSKSVVLFTHFQAKQRLDRLVTHLNVCNQILVMNSAAGGQLISDGVLPERVRVELGYADPTRFFPEMNGERKAVGFVSNFLDNAHYRARKNYEKLFELIGLLCKKYDVLLVGRRFLSSEFRPQLESLKRLKYVEADYSEYRSYYNLMRVFVSVSRLEGGPLALLESMMSGCYPVATCTGFAPDLIKHGENGFILPNTDDMSALLGYIDQAYDRQDKVDVASSVQAYTFKAFAARLSQKLND